MEVGEWVDGQLRQPPFAVARLSLWPGTVLWRPGGPFGHPQAPTTQGKRQQGRETLTAGFQTLVRPKQKLVTLNGRGTSLSGPRHQSIRRAGKATQAQTQVGSCASRGRVQSNPPVAGVLPARVSLSHLV